MLLGIWWVPVLNKASIWLLIYLLHWLIFLHRPVIFQVVLKRHRYNDINTIFTNKTTATLSLSASDNYLIQIKPMSEGGEGVGSEPIHIHKLSKFPVSFFFIPSVTTTTV